jgi:hypothetical protein
MLRAATYSPSYTATGGTTVPYGGTEHTVATMIQLAKGAVDPRQMVMQSLQGERSVPVRRFTEQIINNVRPKDYTSEVVAIGKWWGNAGRYTRDPLHIEMLRDVPTLINDALAGRLACDCDEFAEAIATCCMTIGARCQFVTVGFTPRLVGEPPVYTHVWTRAQDPRSKVWWVLDPVAGRRTSDMLRRIKQWAVYEVQ